MTATAQRTDSQRKAWLLGLMLLAALLVRLPYISSPFLRPHEDDNARYGLAARNHIRLGPWTTRFSNVLSVGGTAPTAEAGRGRPLDFYTHHPGTLSLLIACSLLVFGDKEASVRLVPLVFSLFGIAALYLAVDKRWGWRMAVIAAMVATITPISAYYGKLATFMPVILPLGLCLIDRYGQTLREPLTVKEAALSGGLMALAVSVDYGALFILPALAIAYGPRRNLLAPAAGAAVAFTLLFAQIAWIGGFGSLADLLHQGALRAGAGGAGDHYSMIEFLRVQALEYFPYAAFTVVGALVIVYGVFLLDRFDTERRRFLLALLLWGIGYIVVFNQAAMIHDYWQYYLIPFGAICFALGIQGLSRMNRYAAVLIILVFLDQSRRILERRYYADTGWYRTEFEAIEYARLHARSGDTVLTKIPLQSLQPQYYADVQFVYDPGQPGQNDTFRLQKGPGN